MTGLLQEKIMANYGKTPQQLHFAPLTHKHSKQQLFFSLSALTSQSNVNSHVRARTKRETQEKERKRTTKIVI
jgi:hypothetical protein